MFSLFLCSYKDISAKRLYKINKNIIIVENILIFLTKSGRISV